MLLANLPLISRLRLLKREIKKEDTTKEKVVIEKIGLKDHQRKKLKAKKVLKKPESLEKKENLENKENQGSPESKGNPENRESQESRRMANRLLREMAEREETEMVNNDLLKLYLYSIN